MVVLEDEEILESGYIFAAVSPATLFVMILECNVSLAEVFFQTDATHFSHLVYFVG